MKLQTDRLGLSREGRDVLRDITLSGEAGQILCLMGSNGAGKTTLLRLLLGLLRPDEGRVLLDGRDLARFGRRERARAMAYVPQRHDAFPPYTVSQIVRLGRLPHTGLMQATTGEDEAVIADALAQLGLDPLRDRPCTTLSGGEYQRVLLARSLAQDATVLVLDEPLSGLDFGHQIRFMELLCTLAGRGRLVVMTAHQPDLVYRYASRVALLENGRILATGAPAEILDAERMSAFYGVTLDQHDHGASRFYAGSRRGI